MSARRAAVSVVAAIGASALLLHAGAVEGAIGPRHGGVVTLPSPGALRSFDPARVDSHFGATVASAVFDGLYEIRADGRVDPVLAAGPPEVHGTVATIRLRPGVLHHGGHPLRARHVVASLERAAAHPNGAWLMGAFAEREGRAAIREVDDATIEVELARRGTRADIILAASSLAIVVSGDLRQRATGTGPFRVRRHDGGVRLTNFSQAPDGAPWVNVVQFRAPQSRNEEIRAFELGQIDGSWWGESLYGGRPARPATSVSGTAVTPHLLVRNRQGVLRSDAAFGGVVGAIDRGRLERGGLVPRQSLGAGLPPPSLPRGALRRGLTLRMIVREDRAVEVRVAGAIAAMLGEHGAQLTVQQLSRDRYDAAVRGGTWDLRMVVVRPPLPGRGALVGAAVAAVGDVSRARALTPSLADPEVAAEAARTLDAMVLGHERVTLYHRADLTGLAFDGRGRLSLADMSRVRAVVAPGGAP